MSATPESPNTESFSSLSEGMTLVVCQLTRYILSVNQGNTIYSRARITQQIRAIQETHSIHEKRMRFDIVHKHVNELLRSLYNLELLKLDDKSFILMKKDDSSSAGEEGEESANYESILHETLIADSKTKYKQNTVELEEFYAQHTEMIEDGILCLVLALIIVKKNRVHEQELGKDLLNFGIDPDGVTEFLDMGVVLLKFAKQEYIILQNGVYSLGRRAKLEFDIFSFTLLLKRVFSLTNEQLPQYEQSIKLLVGESYD